MNTDDDARCEEIERRLPSMPLHLEGRPVYMGQRFLEVHLTQESFNALSNTKDDLRFLLDLARTADAMLRTAFLDHGLDVEALLAEAEKRVALKCREICIAEKYRRDGIAANYFIHWLDACDFFSDKLTAAFNLSPLEESGR